MRVCVRLNSLKRQRVLSVSDESENELACHLAGCETLEPNQEKIRMMSAISAHLGLLVLLPAHQDKLFFLLRLFFSPSLVLPNRKQQASILPNELQADEMKFLNNGSHVLSDNKKFRSVKKKSPDDMPSNRTAELVLSEWKEK